MRVVLDTNILISGVLSRESPPARIIDAWLDGAFTLVSAEVQLAEVRTVSRYSHLRQRLKPHLVGTLIRRVRAKGVLVEELPAVDLSPDPDNNRILSIAVAGGADYLVTGDKADLLKLFPPPGLRILSARAFAALLVY